MTADTAPETIHERMAEAQRRISAVAKDDVNKGQNFRFRGVDAVVNAVRPVLAELGIVMRPEAGDPVVERYQTSGGTGMKNIMLPVTWVFTGPAGDTVEARTWGEASDAGDKAIPKAHSIALRIALLQTFLIPTDDVDPDAYSHERAGVAADPALAEDAVSERGWDSVEAAHDAWDTLRAESKLLPAEQADSIRAWLKAKEVVFGTFTADLATEWEVAIAEAKAEATDAADAETERLKADEALDEASE